MPPARSRKQVPTAAKVEIPLAEFIKEGLRIQPRFMPEPIYATSGRGFLRPAGVDEIADAKARAKKSVALKRKRS